MIPKNARYVNKKELSANRKGKKRHVQNALSASAVGGSYAFFKFLASSLYANMNTARNTDGANPTMIPYKIRMPTVIIKEAFFGSGKKVSIAYRNAPIMEI